MKRVDCESGCASFSSFIPSVPCDTRLQVLWGNWPHNQTFPNFERFAAAQLLGGGVAAVTVGAEIFLYLDC